MSLIISENMLTKVKVAFAGFIIKVFYYKGLIIKKAYLTYSVIKYCTVYRWQTRQPTFDQIWANAKLKLLNGPYYHCKQKIRRSKKKSPIRSMSKHPSLGAWVGMLKGVYQRHN